MSGQGPTVSPGVANVSPGVATLSPGAGLCQSAMVTIPNGGQISQVLVIS